MLNFLADAASTTTTTTTIVEPKDAAEWFQQLGDAINQMFAQGKIIENYATNSFFGRLLMALAVFIPCLIAIKILFFIIKHLRTKKDKDYTTSNFVCSSIKGYLYIFLVLTILLILGLPGDSIASIISSAIVAIGLSLQSIIKSFAAGFIIISTKKFKKGDKIVLNKGAVEGTVSEIGVLNTTLLTGDNNILIVSNSDFLSGTLLNKSINKYRRVDLNVSVIYGYDLEEIKKILISCVKKQPGVTLDIKYSASLKELGEDGLIFSVKCYAPSSIDGTVKTELRERIYTEFLNRGIQMPYNLDNTPTKDNDKKGDKIDLSDLKEEDYALNPAPISVGAMEQKAIDDAAKAKKEAKANKKKAK